MTLYFIETRQTIYKAYRVEATSTEEARTLVKTGKVHHHEEVLKPVVVVTDWPLADQTLPAGNIA